MEFGHEKNHKNDDDADDDDDDDDETGHAALCYSSNPNSILGLDSVQIPKENGPQYTYDRARERT